MKNVLWYLIPFVIANPTHESWSLFLWWNLKRLLFSIKLYEVQIQNVRIVLKLKPLMIKDWFSIAFLSFGQILICWMTLALNAKVSQREISSVFSIIIQARRWFFSGDGITFILFMNKCWRQLSTRKDI